MHRIIFTIIGLTALCIVTVHAQDDSKPWERLGLSLTEWKLIQDNNMPMSKVEALLKDGIGISEYFTKPWERIGMTEAKWIARRRSGLTSYDIEQQILLTRNDSSMHAQKKASVALVQGEKSRENRELFASFFLPGYMQCTEQHKVRARFMVALAAGSIVGCTAWSIGGKQFMPLPLFTILIPDMVWSLIDYKLYRQSLMQ